MESVMRSVIQYYSRAGQSNLYCDPHHHLLRHCIKYQYHYHHHHRHSQSTNKLMSALPMFGSAAAHSADNSSQSITDETRTVPPEITMVKQKFPNPSAQSSVWIQTLDTGFFLSFIAEMHFESAKIGGFQRCFPPEL